MTLAMLGKLAISASFMILFVFEAELLPTEVRLQGLAVTLVAANIAGAAAPYVADFLVSFQLVFTGTSVPQG